MMTEDTICRLIIAARTADDLRVLEAYLWFSLPSGYQDQFGLFSDAVPCFMQGGN